VTKNSSFFSEVEQAFLSLSGMRKAVGGNAPVMAKRFIEEGVAVVLGAQMSPALQEQLHPKIEGILHRRRDR
jgi:ADP-dependent glucokinase